MKRYFIEEAKCGITNGGMACGPVPGNVVVTIKYNDGEQTSWLSLIEVDGIPNLALTDKDVFEDLVEEDFDDEEFTEYLQEHMIFDFAGIEFDAHYDTTFACMAEAPENPAIPLIRYLITLVRCPMKEVEGLIKMAAGKYADELDIPMSDVEEEYLEVEDGDEEE